MRPPRRTWRRGNPPPESARPERTARDPRATIRSSAISREQPWTGRAPRRHRGSACAPCPPTADRGRRNTCARTRKRTPSRASIPSRFRFPRRHCNPIGGDRNSEDVPWQLTRSYRRTSDSKRRATSRRAAEVSQLLDDELDCALADRSQRLIGPTAAHVARQIVPVCRIQQLDPLDLYARPHAREEAHDIDADRRP